MERPVIKIQNLTKYYGKRLAVDDISFDVGKGEIVGFLGPNAAGKSTTMRMITGYLLPTRGDVWIADHNMATQSLEGRRLIGYLPEMVPLYSDMTTRRYLDFAARLRGVNKRMIKSRIDEVVQRCGLEEYIDEYLSKISKGFRQRVGLAQAVIHDPKVLILDEPTVGIDPIQVAHTRQLIKDLGKDRTILLSSHILSEVSMICERVVIIHEGRIVAQDRIENLGDILESGKRLRLTVQGPASNVTDCLREINAIRDVTFDAPHHIVEFPSGQEPQAEINAVMFQNGWPLMAMEAVEMSLEEIFLRLTTEKQT